VNSDAFFRWFPPVVAILQLVVLPLLIIALYYVIDQRIAAHNNNLYAHPALNDLKKLEQEIKELSKAIARLELAFAKFTGADPERSERNG
jgi:hypothetical protein